MIVIDKALIDGYLAIVGKLKDVDVQWAVGGDLGEALHGVDTKPDRIEILTNGEGACKIFSAVSDYNPTQVNIMEKELSKIDNLGEGVQSL